MIIKKKKHKQGSGIGFDKDFMCGSGLERGCFLCIRKLNVLRASTDVRWIDVYWCCLAVG